MKFGVWARTFSGVTKLNLSSLEEGCRKPKPGVWECPFSGVTNIKYDRVWGKGAGNRSLESGSAPSMA